MAETILGGALVFFEKLGVFDIILPFLLVFTVTFALLERSKLLGVEEMKFDGETRQFTKKNLNAMAAFVIAFLTVASSQVVGVVTKVSANMVILLLLVVFLLLVVGSFYKAGEIGEDGVKNSYLRGTFLVVIPLTITLIFLDALEMKNGTSWLAFGWDYLLRNWNSSAVAAVMLIAMLIGFVALISRSPHKKSNSGDDDE